MLQPYASSLLTNVANLTNPNTNPYAGLGSYYGATGQTPFAQFNPLQTQAATESASLGPSSYLGQGANLAGAGGLGSINMGQNYLGAAANPFMVGAYMSPYMQNVVDFQKQQAMKDYARTIPGLVASGIRAGGRGGTREALIQSEAQRNLQNQLQGIQAAGSQQAYQGAQDILSKGAQYGLQGYGQGIQAAGTLGNLGQNQFAQQLQAIQQRQALGKDIYGTESDVAKARFADYQAMMNDPLTKMGIYSNILRNIPIAGGTTTTTSPGSSTAGDIAGIGTGIAALYNIFKQ
jgi:hypothetical protein